MSVGPRLEKFHIVSNNHEHTQKCDYCVSVGKTNFTDHHTPDTITALGIQLWSVKYKNCKHLFPFLLIRPIHQAMQAIAMDGLNENKPLQNAFKRV